MWVHTVVKAAGIIVVSTIEDGVHALGAIASRGATGIVDTVAAARVNEDAVRLLPVQRHGRANCAGILVVAVGFSATRSATGRSLGQVVRPSALVVDDGDEAGSAGAKGVLGGSVGDTAGRDRSDVGSLSIRGT